MRMNIGSWQAATRELPLRRRIIRAIGNHRVFVNFVLATRLTSHSIIIYNDESNRLYFIFCANTAFLTYMCAIADINNLNRCCGIFFLKMFLFSFSFFIWTYKLTPGITFSLKKFCSITTESIFDLTRPTSFKIVSLGRKVWTSTNSYRAIVFGSFMGKQFKV